MKNIVVGILAHVDAGKTTLAEALLYKSGKIRNPGRVDNGNTVMDSNRIEKERGITVFSSQAVIELENMKITLLDTPGHVDFSTETERVLKVLDYAILVISATDGVQSHTRTLWKLLELYNIPTFLFVTKMDFGLKSEDEILDGIKSELDAGFVNFNDNSSESYFENISMCDENTLDFYLENGFVDDEETARLIRTRKLFPVYFGSGLKYSGIDEFIDGIEKFVKQPEYPDKFRAVVYKITHEGDLKLTHLKVTGGALKVKDNPDKENENEKINQIRIYNGNKFTTTDSVSSGEICAVSGLIKSYAGQVYGDEQEKKIPVVFEPVMNFDIILPESMDAFTFLPEMRKLEEEDPLLRVKWDAKNRKIQAGLMGKVQAEILKSVVSDRFGVDIEIGECSIQYKETIASKVEGVGHYEPLGHYAEVHLILEPAERGKGIIIKSRCNEDLLDRNWQRLILTHISEKEHIGVLTGSALTDVKITLVSGRAHLKHTEGGDFRQATYRAIRQGLMQAESVLLEPYYSFRIEVPFENAGRVINDIHLMNGTSQAPTENGAFAVIKGRAPVSSFGGYAVEVASFTSGAGKVSCEFDGYDICHNKEKVIEDFSYNPESDMDNSPDSVFCAHGAGFPVKWNEVSNYMHLESSLEKSNDYVPDVKRRNFHIDDKELEAIMNKEFGPVKYELRRTKKPADKAPDNVNLVQRKKCVIVDGYNVIFAWDELKSISENNLSGAREALAQILSNYSAFTEIEVVLVFDAYKVKGNQGKKFDYNNIHVVYTKERELGDVYIERLVSEIGKNEQVTVVSSDNLIQLSAVRFGVLRKSAAEFENEINSVNIKISDIISKIKKENRFSTVGDNLFSEG